MTRTGAASDRVLAEVDVAALFGIDMAPPPVSPMASEEKRETRSKGKAPMQAAPLAGRRGKEKPEPSGNREMKKPTEKSAKQAQRPDVTIAARNGKQPARTRTSTASGKVAA